MGHDVSGEENDCLDRDPDIFHFGLGVPSVGEEYYGISSLARCEILLKDAQSHFDALRQAGERQASKGTCGSQSGQEKDAAMKRVLSGVIDSGVKHCPQQCDNQHPDSAFIRRGKNDSDLGLCFPTSGLRNLKRRVVEILGDQENGAEWHDAANPIVRAKRTYRSRRKKKFQGSANLPTQHAISRDMDFSTTEFDMPPCGLSRRREVGQEDYDSQGSDLPHTKRCPKHMCLHTFSKRRKMSKEEEGLFKITNQFDKDHRQALQQLCRYMAVLFEQTSSGTNSRRIGAKSLFSTCLAQIPKYAAEEVYKPGEDECSNIAPNILDTYNDVDAYFSTGTAESSWRLLGPLVRHHVVHMIGREIQKGAYAFVHVEDLVTICVRQGAEEEAKMLLDSFLTRSRLQHSSDLRIFEKFAMQTGQYGYAFRAMALLIEGNRLPCHTLKSRLVAACLNCAVQVVANMKSEDVLEDGHFGPAALLVRTVVRQSYLNWEFDLSDMIHDVRLGRSRRGEQIVRSSYHPDAGERVQKISYISSKEDGGRKPLGSASFNALAVLSAINILRQKDSVNQEAEDCHIGLDMLQQMSLEARQYLEIVGAERICQESNDDQLIIPLLAAGLPTLIGDLKEQTTTSSIPLDISALADLIPGSSAIKRAGSFLSKITRLCAKATNAENEFSVMQDVFEQITAAGRTFSLDMQARSILSNIQIAAAFCLSQESHRADRQEWAIMISQAASLAKIAGITGTPSRKIARQDDEYRWEEGIAEWIEASPVPVILKPEGLHSWSPDESDGGGEQIPPPTLINEWSQNPAPRSKTPSLDQSREQSRPGAKSETDSESMQQSEADESPMMTPTNISGHTTLLCVRVNDTAPAPPSHPTVTTSPSPTRASRSAPNIMIENDIDELSTSTSTAYAPPRARQRSSAHPTAELTHSRRKRRVLAEGGNGRVGKHCGDLQRRRNKEWVVVLDNDDDDDDELGLVL